MRYGKPALTFGDQADRLLHRGLTANRDELISRLEAVNYYRLSGYLYPFRNLPGEQFATGTHLNTVWRRYVFDRRLRLIVLDAVERIEIAVRTRLVYHFVHAHGPFGHLDDRNLPGFKKPHGWAKWQKLLKALLHGRGTVRSDHQNWLGRLDRETKRAQGEAFVKHFKTTYGDMHDALPLWMVCELMSCGSVQELLNAAGPTIQKQVAADFGYPDALLLSWTKAVFSLRNACAHHARIWNRIFGVRPLVPGKNKNPAWHMAPVFAQDRAGLLLTVCHSWLGRITSTSQWKIRLFGLFNDFPEIPLGDMGMPATWQHHPLWH